MRSAPKLKAIGQKTDIPKKVLIGPPKQIWKELLVAGPDKKHYFDQIPYFQISGHVIEYSFMTKKFAHFILILIALSKMKLLYVVGFVWETQGLKKNKFPDTWE